MSSHLDWTTFVNKGFIISQRRFRFVKNQELLVVYYIYIYYNIYSVYIIYILYIYSIYYIIYCGILNPRQLFMFFFLIVFCFFFYFNCLLSLFVTPSSTQLTHCIWHCQWYNEPWIAWLFYLIFIRLSSDKEKNKKWSLWFLCCLFMWGRKFLIEPFSVTKDLSKQKHLRSEVEC